MEARGLSLTSAQMIVEPPFGLWDTAGPSALTDASHAVKTGPVRLIVVTAKWPFGRGEEFLADEMEALAAVTRVIVYPRDNPGAGTARQSNTESLETADRRCHVLRGGLMVPMSRRTISVVTNARTVIEVVRNLIKLPNVLGLISLLEQWPTARIHAYWGTTSATVAMVASEVIGRPWSFTLHRGDIKANNLLRLKAQSAAFVRCISNQGREWAIRLIGSDLRHKLMMIPMGVKVPAERAIARANSACGRLTAFVPARLVPVKGHIVLIEAMRMVQKRHGGRLQCVFAGDGPERGRLEAAVRRHGLNEMISFAGAIPRDEIVDWYRSGRVDMAVLPSIVTADGEHEGVPVSLMEAMAHGIPVVSTRSGAIPELLENAGILVEPNNSVQLAEAIGALCSAPRLAQRVAAAGRGVVQRRFNVDTTVPALMSSIEGSDS